MEQQWEQGKNIQNQEKGHDTIIGRVSMNENKYSSIIDRVIDKMYDLKTVYETDVHVGTNYMDLWEWPQGVGLFGLYLYYKETGEKKYFDMIVDYFEKHIKKGLPVKNVNTMCPMLTLTYVYEETKNEKYLALCKEWLAYVMHDMPRTEENGIQHITSADENFQQLWDDTLYMTVLFVARMGVLLQDDAYIQESIQQFLVHLKYLTDPKTGLFFHGWTFDGNHHFANALWARGNAWYTAGLVDYLEICSIPEGVKKYLITSLQRQVKKLAEIQLPNGMWTTLLDDATSYPEASATAAFAYGILKAVRCGYIDQKYKETGLKALEGVIGCIAADGTVNQVSYGTGMGNTLEDYKKIPVTPQLYGQSMTMLLLCEALKA